MRSYTVGIPVDGGRTRLPMQIEGARRERLASLLTGEQILFVSIPADQSMGQAWFTFAALASGTAVAFTASSTDGDGWEEYGTMNVEFLAPAA